MPSDLDAPSEKCPGCADCQPALTPSGDAAPLDAMGWLRRAREDDWDVTDWAHTLAASAAALQEAREREQRVNQLFAAEVDEWRALAATLQADNERLRGAAQQVADYWIGDRAPNEEAVERLRAALAPAASRPVLGVCPVCDHDHEERCAATVSHDAGVPGVCGCQYHPATPVSDREGQG